MRITEGAQRVRVTAHLTNGQDGQIETRLIDVSDDATICDLYNAGAFSGRFNVHIAADHYYRVQNESLVAFPHHLQFVIERNVVRWYPDPSETRLSDFFATHGILNGEIHLRYGVGGWGGGLIDYLPAWDQLLKSIEAAVAIASATDYGRRAISYFRGNTWQRWRLPRQLGKMTPARVLSLIGQRDYWNVYDLAEKTGWRTENVAYLLRGLGYEYDKRRHQYGATKETNQRFETINATKFAIGEPARPIQTKRKGYARRRTR